MMRLKLIPLFAGVLALTISAPLTVKAQTNQPNQPVPQQQPPKQPQGGIELTPQQQEQLTQIRRDTRAQIQKVLTPKQQEQFKTAVQSGENRQAAFAAMKLTKEQQTKLQGILQSARTKTEAILTPEQRQQVQQSIQQPQPSAK